jgi:serine/threonine protein kinase
MPLAAGTRLGPYEVLGLIGAGGMGEVYKAHDTRLDRTVAIKALPSELSTDQERRTRRPLTSRRRSPRPSTPHTHTASPTATSSRAT